MPETGPFTVTSLDLINATGVLFAVKDGENHVSVMPTNPARMQEWMDSRDFALINPHEYTRLLQSISFRVK